MEDSNKLACGEIRGKIIEYIEGELSAKESADIEEHIAGCEECRKEYNGQKQFFFDALAGLSAEPPAYLHEKIMKAVAKEKTVEKRMRLIRRLAMPVAAALLVVALIPAVMRGMAGDDVLTPANVDPRTALYDMEYAVNGDDVNYLPAEDVAEEAVVPTDTPSAPSDGSVNGGASADTYSASADSCAPEYTEDQAVTPSVPENSKLNIEQGGRVYIVSRDEFDKLLAEKNFLSYFASLFYILYFFWLF